MPEIGDQPLPPKTYLAKEVIIQLQCYFADPHFKFDLPFALPTHLLHKAVLEILMTIPPGATQTYGDIAAQLHTSPRAVGRLCRKNPLPLLIPCHRVIGKRDLGGYNGAKRGAKLSLKQWLLSHESYDDSL
jgi:methylated-DNA-[protein]-cysteine S-methyltransferase